ncbi:hypothetical protein [Streptomyces incanus]|uniref:Uncharacterized protein n=1 Tax=Streptomyces incanus TaxID=887453 RepID=A0ABW0XWQ5_9ACTN
MSRSGGSCGSRRTDRGTTGHENANCGNRKEVLQTLRLHDHAFPLIDLHVVGRAIFGRGHKKMRGVILNSPRVMGEELPCPAP